MCGRVTLPVPAAATPTAPSEERGATAAEGHDDPYYCEYGDNDAIDYLS